MKFQGSATFLCPFGFDLVGPDSITCGPDGKWNGPVPSCKGKTKPMQSVLNNDVARDCSSDHLKHSQQLL